MRVDKPVIQSQLSVEVEPNSQPQAANSNATELAQDSVNNFPKTTYGDELTAFADLSGQMRYRDLMNQFNSKTLAYQNYPPPPNLTPAPTGTPTGVPGSSPTGDDLGKAAASGDIKELQRLIASGVDINSPNSKTGMTPLMQAAQTGKLDAMKLLLAQKPKPDVDAQDKEQRTAMYYAVENKNSDALALLKKEKADPNIPARFGRYPIMEAAQRGDAKSVKILASGGRAKENSDLSKKDVNERTALHEAAKYGNADTVKVLLEEYAGVSHQDVQGRSALMDAAERGNSASTRLLLDRINKYDPEFRSKLINAKDDQDRTALMEAARSGNKDTVAELLKSKEIQINLQDKEGKTALMHAIEKKDLNSVKALIAAKAQLDLKADGKTAVMIAQEMRQKATTPDEQKAADQILQALGVKP
ncbi:ankyrin repeat domain-containing protein [bacterium]|nr:ankyrin repeat domain-containing protein [bacterium]